MRLLKDMESFTSELDRVRTVTLQGFDLRDLYMQAMIAKSGSLDSIS